MARYERLIKHKDDVRSGGAGYEEVVRRKGRGRQPYRG